MAYAAVYIAKFVRIVVDINIWYNYVRLLKRKTTKSQFEWIARGVGTQCCDVEK